jgi:hypothetical protein
MHDVMKKWFYFLSFYSIMLLSGCHSGEQKLIFEYEQNVNQILVTKIISEGEFIPFHAHDSILILEREYDSVYRVKVKSLQEQLERISQKLNKIEMDLETVENPLMVAAIESRMKPMKYEQNSIKIVISIYQNTSEKTQLVEITKRIDYLKMSPDSLLGYTLKISFLGNQGALPKEICQRNYLFNVNNSKIVGLIQH